MKNCCKDVSKSNEVSSKNFEELICYCFKKSKRELYEAIIGAQSEQFVASIKKLMKDPGCFCEQSNPSKKCCLADIQAFIEAVKART